jgi:general secretion pathway protein L
MSDTLIIRFTATKDLYDWVSLDSSGTLSSSGKSPLAAVAGLAKNCKVILLAPALSVLRLSAKIPIKGEAKIRNALPFALEEQVAGNIEAQHFAFSKASATGQIPVAVIEKQLLNNWLSEFEAAGVMINSLYAESEGLTALPATISLLIDGDTTIIQDHLGEYTITDTESLQFILEMILEQHNEAMTNDAAMVPVNILIYCSNEFHEQQQSLWDRLRMLAENVEIKLLADGTLPFLAAQVTNNKCINLLQGVYAPKSDLNIEWGPWKLPAAMLGSLVLLLLVIKGLSFWQLNQTETKLDAAAVTILQQTFPDAANSSDPWGTLQSRLGSSTLEGSEESIGFAITLQTLAQAFKAAPNLKLETLSFRAGIIDLQLVAPDVDALDKLRQQIAESEEFDATIQSANPDKDVIKGRVQITRSST